MPRHTCNRLPYTSGCTWRLISTYHRLRESVLRGVVASIRMDTVATDDGRDALMRELFERRLDLWRAGAVPTTEMKSCWRARVQI